MKSVIVGSLIVGAVGALGAIAVRDAWNQQRAHAQELFAPPQDQLPAVVTAPRPETPQSLPQIEPRAADDVLADFTPEERVNIAVYETCNRGVVNISTKVVTETLLFDIPSEGAGSGSVIDQAGHILTNYHVVSDAESINVTLFDGETYQASLVGRDPSNDIAVLKIEAPVESLVPIVFGDSSRLRVGQSVYAIGNPFGLERTLTTGIVSSLNRSLPGRNGRTMKSIIQIDAAINPGNSGGPLIDSRGRLIGMNTAIASKTGQNTGVGFAIPAATIARVVPQLVERGEVVRPDVGITRVYQTERGLLIAGLTAGGPAERAGLRGPQRTVQKRRQGPFMVESQKLDISAADLIVEVNGEKIKTADDFLGLIEAHSPGSEVALTIIRDNQRFQARVRLGLSRE
ncbi:MAG: trypsin-like peptidase domain-containing protein [Pirellulales bacterium]